MKLIIFEDHLTKNLEPFSLNHAAFEIKTGLFSNIDRFIDSFPKHEVYLIVRDEIKDIIKFRFPKYDVNPSVIPRGECINAKVVWDKDYIKLFNNENLLLFRNNSEISLEEFNLKIRKLKNNDSISNINYIWDSIYLFSSIIKKDFLKVKNTDVSNIDNVCLINKNFISINNNVNIKPGVIIDATNGPVYINNNVEIDIGALIQGPVFIDKDSYISPGSKIRGGTLIGPNCKVGGEVTNSIFHGFSNKVHDGFIGHSYIGEWVNIGAGTITCNYDGKSKQKTIIEDGAFIGSNSSLIAPIKIEKNAYIGSGSAISKNVKANSLAIERSKQMEVKNWSKKVKK